MNTVIASVLAALVLGTGATAVAVEQATRADAPQCADLAGQGTLCADVVVDPLGSGGVDANVTAVVAPSVPPLPPPPGVPPVAAAAAPTCVDLAGQGNLCADAGTSGADVTYEVDQAETGLSGSGAVHVGI